MTRTWLEARVAAFAAASALAAALPISAHHSWTATYLEDQTVSVEGEIVELAYQNPHAWLHVSSRDNSGRMQTIGAEWASPSRLSQQGVTRETLKPGDRVILTGSPDRDPAAYRMHLKRIERPADGWKWIGGNQPR